MKKLFYIIISLFFASTAVAQDLKPIALKDGANAYETGVSRASHARTTERARTDEAHSKRRLKI